MVALTQAMGPGQVMAGLRRAGARPEVQGGAPGLAVALGGLGLTLEDLVGVYAAIANGGTRVDLHWAQGATPGFVPQVVMGDVASWHVADILLETPRPAGVRGTGIAFKTGTSYGHRDAWALGFDGRHVVGVWMGRADGTAVPGAFGGDLAAPVLFAAFQRVRPQADPIRPPPPATLLLTNAQLPVPLQRFGPRNAQAQGDGPLIAFPPDGAVVEGDSLIARVEHGTAPFTWLANGLPVATGHARQMEFDALGRGFSALTVIDSAGRTAQARVELR